MSTHASVLNVWLCCCLGMDENLCKTTQKLCQQVEHVVGVTAWNILPHKVGWIV